MIPGDDFISIAIPLTLIVPDWWNATMDTSIQLRVGMGANGTVLVVPSVDVHVTWTWLQDLTKCTEFGQQISQAFMTEIVNNQLAAGIAQQLTSHVQQVANSAQMADPQKRTYALTSLVYTSDKITFTVCPTSPPIRVHPIGNLG